MSEKEKLKYDDGNERRQQELHFQRVTSSADSVVSRTHCADVNDAGADGSPIFGSGEVWRRRHCYPRDYLVMLVLRN